MALSIPHALAATVALEAAFEALQRDLRAAQERLQHLSTHAALLQGAGCSNAPAAAHPLSSAQGPPPSPASGTYPHPQAPGAQEPQPGCGAPSPGPPPSTGGGDCYPTHGATHVEGLLGNALAAVRAAVAAADGLWRRIQEGVEEGHQRVAAAALDSNLHHNHLIANTLSVDAVAVLVTSYLSVKDQCRSQLVSRALAAVTTRSLRALTECTVQGAMPPPVCTFVMRCLPALRTLALKRTSSTPSPIATSASPSPSTPLVAPLSLTLASTQGRLSLTGSHLASPTSTPSSASGPACPSPGATSPVAPIPRHTLDDVLRSCTSITSLHCDAGTEVTDTSLLMFAVYCTGARSLALPGARVSDVGLHALARACGSLLHLDLSSCAAVTGAALTALASTCTQLTTVNVNTTNADNTLLMALGEHCKALTVVKVSWCRGVGDPGILALIDGCPRLQHLDTAGNLITDVTLGAAGRLSRLDVGRCRLLRHPGLTSCFWGQGRPAPLLDFRASATVGISDATLLALAHAAPGLRSLDISLCVVTDVGVLAVITGCPQLERLSVAGLPITEGAVAQMPESLRRLRKLDVSGCHMSLRALLSMPSLRAVRASRCEGASPEWVQAALQKGLVVATG